MNYCNKKHSAPGRSSGRSAAPNRHRSGQWSWLSPFHRRLWSMGSALSWSGVPGQVCCFVWWLTHTPPENMSSSIEMMNIPNAWKTCSKPPTSWDLMVFFLNQIILPFPSIIVMSMIHRNTWLVRCCPMAAEILFLALVWYEYRPLSYWW